MKRLRARLLIAGAVVVASAAVAVLPALQQPAQVTIDYPAEGSIFPPEITAPTFLWRDAAESAQPWRIDVDFGDGSAGDSRQNRRASGCASARSTRAASRTPTNSPS